jgi:hypothetical protein
MRAYETNKCCQRGEKMVFPLPPNGEHLPS